MLTQLQRPSAVLDLPSDFDRLLLVSASSERVVAELGRRSAHRIAVPSGSYNLRAWKGGQTFAARVVLGQGQERRLASAEFSPVRAGSAAAKGDGDAETVSAMAAPVAALQRPWFTSLEIGVMDGAAKDAVLAGGRLGVGRRFGSIGVTARLSAGTGRAPGMRENRFAGEVVGSWWLGRGRLSAGLGLGLGAGAGLEHLDGGGQIHWTGLAVASPAALLQVRLGQRLALLVGAELPLTLLRRDDRITVAVLPAGWLGIARGF